MLIYTVTILLSAFLLFQVQPLIAKYILPWFGGSPAVWTTSMMLFQSLLLVGYAYAHWNTRRLKAGAQTAIHSALLAVALIQLPIIPDTSWQPNSADIPVWRVLAALVMTIGLPYLALSSTAPLIQAWFSRTFPDRSPYRLYALSNAGSLAALISYPFVFEPALARNTQAILWSAGFGGFVLLCGFSAVWAWRRAPSTRQPADGLDPPLDDDAPLPTLGRRALWLALSATAVVMLLAITNQITQDIAVVPFLWVLPLSLYLLTFVIAFDAPRWAMRPMLPVLLIPATAAVIWLQAVQVTATIALQIGLYSAALFICCLVCHSELSRLKPGPEHLTGYYLMIALGGALGGVFVALLAPAIFNDFLELPLGLLAVCGLTLVIFFVDKNYTLYRGHPAWAWVALGSAYLALLGALGYQMLSNQRMTPVYRARDFYGVLTVNEVDADTPNEHLSLIHGVIIHGTQYTDPDKDEWPLSYYATYSGAGLTMEHFRAGASRRVGIIGLGVGTLATYGREGDYFRFYEINPEVVHIANTTFTYLSNSDAQIDVILGDARLSLEQEDPQQFDILVLDAFTGDAIPAHLLTTEAFEVYLRHLKEDGVIVVQVTNRYINLEPVIRDLADHFNMEAVIIKSGPNPARQIMHAKWGLVTTNRSFLDIPEVASVAYEPERKSGLRLWTDDYTSLFPIMYLK